MFAFDADGSRIGTTRTEHDGDFVLESWRDDETIVAVQARKAGLGSSVRTAVAEDAPEPTLVLTGSGTITGRLVDADGRPLEGRSVVAKRHDLEAEVPGFTGDRLKLLAAEANGGLARVEVQTDPDGRFVFAGLQDTSVRFEARTSWDRFEWYADLTREALPVGTTDLTLQAAPATIEVQVVDADGIPMECRHREGWISLAGPAGVAAFRAVGLTAGIDGDVLDLFAPLDAVEQGDGAWKVRASPWSKVRLFASDPARGSTSLDVDLGAPGSRTRATLVLPARRIPARIELEVLDPAQLLGRYDGVHLTLLDPRTEDPVLDFAKNWLWNRPEGHDPKARHQWQVPAGQWLATVQFDDGPLFCGNRAMPPQFLPTIGFELALDPGSPRSLQVEVVEPGRLRLVSDAPEDAAQLERGRWRELSMARQLRVDAISADVVRLDTGERIRLSFHPPRDDPQQEPLIRHRMLPLGQTALAWNALRPGRYRLETRRLDAPAQRTEFTIRAGETTTVRVLAPRTR